MKVFAYYLPQFHEIDENNEWWGKGFTEWTSVKNARPLFPGHIQPKKPKNDWYYDLLDTETLPKQAKMARSFGVDGFAYYHYWFNGRLILDKPVLNLLKAPGIDLEFFFCWANHSWYRSWDGSKTMLIQQSYGEEAEWTNHFNYLKDYFQDPRYLKIDGAPVLSVYDSSSIPRLAERLQFYSDLARSNGFSGIYWIDTTKLSSEETDFSLFDASVLREPNVSWSLEPYLANLKRRFVRKLRLGVPTFQYRSLVRSSIGEYKRRTGNYLPCAFTGWDNTPRHGRNGKIVLNSGPNLFGEYVGNLLSMHKDRPLLMINAWNEWAEGMQLEPDEQYSGDSLKYLSDAVRKFKLSI